MNEEELLLAEDDDMILPEGWDGESDFLASAEADGEENQDDPTKDDYDLEKLDAESEPTEEVKEGTEETELDVEDTNTELTETEDVKDELSTQLEKQNQPRLKVTFNHEEKELDMEEAKMYAQKGMNYDRLEPTYREATQLAKDLGYASLKEMIEETRKSRFEDEVQAMVDDGLSESTARSIVESNRRATEEARVLAEQQAEAEAQRLAEQEQQNKMSAEIDMFVKAFPGVTVIPDSVKQAVAQGLPLTAAYAQYVANQSQIELQKQKQRSDAEKRAPVRSATSHGKVESQVKSAFEEGFDEDDW